MTTLLIDGDILVYGAAFCAEETHEFGDEWVTTANLQKAQEGFSETIKNLSEKLKADNIVVALSDGENWRKAIYPNYKAQRKKVRKPVLLRPMREWVSTEFHTFMRPTLEADDVLGILATSKKIPGRKIVVSIDKDLLQVPGEHYNPDKPALGVRTVTQDQGDYHHLIQTLTGDVVDNYPGCPGIGPKKAEAILFGVSPPWGASPEAWTAITAAYTKKGLTSDDALVQARIARICRSSDYDFATRSVRLWTPAEP